MLAADHRLAIPILIHGDAVPVPLPDVEEDAGPRSESGWAGLLGDARWPVRPERVDDFLNLAEGAAPGTHRGGVVARFAGIRKRCQAKHLVKDSGRIPKGEQIMVQLSRGDAHYGLRCTRDAARYAAALKMASCIERHFNRRSNHRGQGILVSVGVLLIKCLHHMHNAPMQGSLFKRKASEEPNRNSQTYLCF